MRFLGACVTLLVVASAWAVAPAAADESTSVEDLRHQRTELVQRIAELTDEADRSQAAAAEARDQRAAAESGLREARRRFARHAVDAYVDGVQLVQDAQLRRKGWADVIATNDRALLQQLQRAQAEAGTERAAAEAAVHEARQDLGRLEDLRARLERNIAERERADAARARRLAEESAARARRSAEAAAARTAGNATQRARVVRTTGSQAQLMARFPFGPVARIPTGLVPTGQIVAGPASWYGPGFDGRPTASGAVFDQEGFTVASRTLPLGTILLISYGGRGVLALVNDRGPFVAGRVLDLSHGVAAALGTVQRGVAPVHAQVLVPAGP